MQHNEVYSYQYMTQSNNHFIINLVSDDSIKIRNSEMIHNDWTSGRLYKRTFSCNEYTILPDSTVQTSVDFQHVSVIYTISPSEFYIKLIAFTYCFQKYESCFMVEISVSFFSLTDTTIWQHSQRPVSASNRHNHDGVSNSNSPRQLLVHLAQCK